MALLGPYNNAPGLPEPTEEDLRRGAALLGLCALLALGLGGVAEGLGRLHGVPEWVRVAAVCAALLVGALVIFRVIYAEPGRPAPPRAPEVELASDVELVADLELGPAPPAAEPDAHPLTCPYCRYPIRDDEDRIACPRCGIPHHRECWAANGGCTTYGCGGRA
jgi:hypothetical protein